jgi:cytochrome c-type protein NapC
MIGAPAALAPATLLALLILLTAVLAAFLIFRPAITHTRGGKILAFVALFLLPLLVGYGGVVVHLDHSKRTEFCLSCHVMQQYGRSLLIEDRSHIPAVHFQNNLVPREAACYTCHTNYTLYGGFTAKLRGLRHLYVQYIGTVPERAHLYTPYSNRECLYCHDGARSFEEQPVHSADAEIMASILSNELSCLSCHEVVHDVQNLDGATFWRDTLPPNGRNSGTNIE